MQLKINDLLNNSDKGFKPKEIRVHYDLTNPYKLELRKFTD